MSRWLQTIQTGTVVSTWVLRARMDGKITAKEVIDLLMEVGEIWDIEEFRRMEFQIGEDGGIKEMVFED